MADSIEDKVKQIIVDELGVEETEVTRNARFIDDLGADSLDTVELVMRFEEEFGIEIPDEEAEKIQSVGDAITYIEEHKKYARILAGAKTAMSHKRAQDKQNRIAARILFVSSMPFCGCFSLTRTLSRGRKS